MWVHEIKLVVQIEDQDEAFSFLSGTADFIGNLYEQFGGTSIMRKDNICIIQWKNISNCNWNIEALEFFSH